ncbi:hypothetical protein [Candidatus Nitrosotalea okcheonensis]|uniref:C2H2-type domain-containing protein n=1 Tax=Candidatus Nitrosotalea okcheonensis TaxID=1903276 RepID=A0A2H1FDE8_9ARCH|nr:hypothetical protein [Candidatus Nitrosotalea okcheonensis]SMH70784.1 conserved protein of unknown function [Candidatus Nitrosotalea okcheonensis]
MDTTNILSTMPLYHDSMTYVDCAGDDTVAQELETYLKSHGFSAKADKSMIVVNENDIDHILVHFLKETNRLDYKIRKIDSENLLLSKEVQLEDFGFFRCEMCGYALSSQEELLVHRRAHGIQLL